MSNARLHWVADPWSVYRNLDALLWLTGIVHSDNPAGITMLWCSAHYSFCVKALVSEITAGAVQFAAIGIVVQCCYYYAAFWLHCCRLRLHLLLLVGVVFRSMVYDFRLCDPIFQFHHSTCRSCHSLSTRSTHYICTENVSRSKKLI